MTCKVMFSIFALMNLEKVANSKAWKQCTDCGIRQQMKTILQEQKISYGYFVSVTNSLDMWSFA